MANRKSPVKRRVTSEQSGDMLIVRDTSPIKKPSEKEIEGMKKRAFTRKYPNTSV